MSENADLLEKSVYPNEASRELPRGASGTARPRRRLTLSLVAT